MSKYRKTKSDVLKLISENKDTLSIISSELGLAPSTVSKHLNELQDLGAIRLVKSEYAKKWKHYELNAGFDGTFPETIAAKINYNRSAKSKYALAGLLIIAAIAGLLAILSLSPNPQNQVPIAITDPPYLPVETSAVMLNYSSITINYTLGGMNKTIDLNTSGTLNAMDLVNVSKIIATAKIMGGSTIRSVSINISSGSITIDNYTYALTIPVRRFYTTVVGNGTVNSSTLILLDLSSVVVPYFSNYSNGTESFAFMPKLSSVLGYVNRSQASGNVTDYWKRMLLANESMPLKEFGGNVKSLFNESNIKVANASINLNGSKNGLSISLINMGNNTTTIDGVAVLSCVFMPNGIITPNIKNAIAQGNAIVYNGSNATLTINISKLYMHWNSKPISINITKNTHRVVITGHPYAMAQMQQMNRQMPMLGISFSVLKNGSISPVLWGKPKTASNIGYNLGPKSTVELNYAATNSSMQTRMLDSISGSGDYRVIILTSNGIAVYDNGRNGTKCG